MEKTLTIEGRQITFKCTGGTLRRYRDQFNAEFLTDLAGFTAAKKNIGTFSLASIENIIWTLAKTADNTIPDPQTWFDSFEEFDTFTVWKELADIVSHSLKPIVKQLKNAEAAASQKE